MINIFIVLADDQEITERSPSRTSLLNNVTSDELPLLADAAVTPGIDDNQCQDQIGELNNFEFTVENRLLIDPPVNGQPYD